MILIYNGAMLQEKINFKKFRKFAFKYGLKYQSWEEGEYIEAFGPMSKKTLKKLLR
ncbi:U exon [Egyptian fruit bat adenovirus]|uniref:U exon n=1 Tax=Egyptian fruit bat adenovirus TaxID=2849732 RepID=A0A344X9V7_9ADEN|nr:U exon [Rousettus aegyptiacus adenovirus]AXE75639.1 U exon [Egyptian fruit bat adenovirus]